jgi:hypothetical protein
MMSIAPLGSARAVFALEIRIAVLVFCNISGELSRFPENRLTSGHLADKFE